jgi:hypothetical protein
MPVLPAWKFYPQYAAEMLRKFGQWSRLYLKLRWTYELIKRDPRRYEYSDLALTPVTDDEAETYELFTHQQAV